MNVEPYLLFTGNCEEALKHYAKVLNGTIEAMMTAEGTPAEPHMPADWKKKILHARLRVGDGAILASDAPPGRQSPMGGFNVTLNVKSVAEAKRIYDAFLDGGKSDMPFGPTFFAAGYGMVKDKFGTPWIIICQAEG